MLVLSRRRNEGIVIADDIEIVVVEIREDRVRLGIGGRRCASHSSPGGLRRHSPANDRHCTTLATRLTGWISGSNSQPTTSHLRKIPFT